MQKIITQLPGIKLIGISVRTNNATEIDPSKAKISSTIQKYANGLSDQIPHRKNPGITYCAYTNYESDFNGDYTYFIGEEVSSFDGVTSELETLSIPGQHYTKFTNGPGKMPDVCINAWQQIWQMSSSDFGGERGYIADLEVYNMLNFDPDNAKLDIYIGIKK